MLTCRTTPVGGSSFSVPVPAISTLVLEVMYLSNLKVHLPLLKSRARAKTILSYLSEAPLCLRSEGQFEINVCALNALIALMCGGV